jgi:4'-phosphopantetheinyl transferase
MRQVTPTEVPPLGVGDCQVWWARLAGMRTSRVSLLDSVERKRHAAYRELADRDRFAVGVVVTRMVLGAHLGVAPDLVSINRTCPDCGRADGRPRLATDAGVRFSVSHSGDVVVVAFTTDCAVGVDVERLDASRGPELAQLILSPAERADFDALPPAGQLSGFFRYWVRKEAVLKATGDGLRVPLRDLTVSTPDEPPRLVEWVGRPEVPPRAHLVDLHRDPEYAASLAFVGGSPVVHEFDADGLLGGLG